MYRKYQQASSRLSSEVKLPASRAAVRHDTVFTVLITSIKSNRRSWGQHEDTQQIARL